MLTTVRIALALMLLLSSPLLAQSPRALSPATDATKRNLSAKLFLHEPKALGHAPASSLSERRLVVDAAVASPLFANSGDLVFADFPIGQSENGEIELRRLRPIIDANTEVWIGTGHGDIPGRIPDVVSYRGTIRSESGSRVFVSLIDGRMYGIIKRGNGSSRILAPAPEPASRGAHLLVPESVFQAFPAAARLRCGADRTPNYFRSGKVPFTPSLLASTLLEVKVAVEADNSFLQRTGGTVEKATAYIAALFGMVSSMYEDEVNVHFYLPWIKIWSAPDPYQVAGNGYTLFDKAPAYWRANYQSVDRNIVHVLTASEWGGGGVGFRGEGIDGRSPVICSKDYGYSVSSVRGVFSFPTFAFTYDAYIVAHEIGHNFGARHTHDCWWSPALDTCYTKDDPKYKLSDACFSLPIKPRPSSGSIMSYCAANNYEASGGVFDSSKVELTFTPRVAAVMRKEAELSSCLREPVDPMIVLTNPRGESKSYNVDSTIRVTWRSARITNVTLQYSTDNGATWRDIVAGVPVSPQEYSWKLPNVCSDRVVVRISDASNPAVADSSLIPFTVNDISISPPGPIILCSGDSVVLDAGQRSSYRWSNGALTRTITVREGGFYSVLVDNGNGCSGSTTATVRMAVPTAPTITRSHDTLVSTLAGTYQWKLDDAPIPGAVNRTHLPSVDGRYTVTITDANSCGELSSASYNYSRITKVESDHAGAGIADLTVVAESANGQIVVAFTLARPDMVGVTLFDNQGREVAALADEQQTGGSSVLHLPIRALPSGTYILELRAGGSVATRKLMVRK